MRRPCSSSSSSFLSLVDFWAERFALSAKNFSILFCFGFFVWRFRGGEVRRVEEEVAFWGVREKGEEGMDGCRLWRKKKIVFFFFFSFFGESPGNSKCVQQ